MIESKLKWPEALAPNLIEKGILEKWFGWYDTWYNRYPLLSVALLLIFVSFIVVFLPLVIVAEINDIVGAYWAVSAQMRAHPVLLNFLTIIAVSLLLTISFHRQVKLIVTMVHLHIWCSRRGYALISNTIVERSRHIVWSWTKYLDGSVTATARSRPVQIVAYGALVSAYLDGLAAIRSGQPLPGSTAASSTSVHPLLPSNFLLYARCVEQIRQTTASSFDSSSQIRIAIRTLLTGDIQRWYNIQRVHLPGDRTLWCSTTWWETYKEQVRHKKLEPLQISLHRLLRYDPTANTDELSVQQQYLRLHIRNEIGEDREYLNPAEFLEVKTELEQLGMGHAIEWLGGAQFITQAELQNVPLVPLHPICKVLDTDVRGQLYHWGTGRYRFTSAFETYKSYHQTFQESPLVPISAGAWGRQTDKREIDTTAFPCVTSNDDLFLVDFIRVGPTSEVQGRFGISFRIEEDRDTAGIRLLSNKELSIAVDQFDEVWRQAKPL